MTILTEFGNLHISLKWKDVLPKKLSSSFCHALAYLSWKYERNRTFDPCRVIFHFYGQGLLKPHVCVSIRTRTRFILRMSLVFQSHASEHWRVVWLNYAVAYVTCIKPVIDDVRHLWLWKMWHNFRIHSVRFSKTRAYLTYPLVFEDVRVGSGVVHLVFQSQTFEQLRVFENIRVINDHYIFEEHLMQHYSTKT